MYVCFFFQAEDGIRDLTVTGVQTCALPISVLARYAPAELPQKTTKKIRLCAWFSPPRPHSMMAAHAQSANSARPRLARSTPLENQVLIDRHASRILLHANACSS